MPSFQNSCILILRGKEIDWKPPHLKLFYLKVRNDWLLKACLICCLPTGPATPRCPRVKTNIIQSCIGKNKSSQGYYYLLYLSSLRYVYKVNPILVMFKFWIAVSQVSFAEGSQYSSNMLSEFCAQRRTSGQVTSQLKAEDKWVAVNGGHRLEAFNGRNGNENWKTILGIYRR